MIATLMAPMAGLPRRLVSAAALALLLSGCAGLGTLNAVATPTDLYQLTPKSTFASNLPRLTQQIVVEEPTATAAVNTDRIAVLPNPLQVQYLPRARWVDRAPVIVQSLLIESYENSDRVAAVGRSAVGLRADYLIVPDLREFQASVPDRPAPNGEPLEITVRLNVKVVDAFEDRIIASKSFEKVAYAPTEATIDTVNAFDRALGSTMRNAVEWSVRRMYSHAASTPTSAF
ncbi:MAG: ABC-type transport auxiliary lipoprotein family protein [Marinibacterium sp.]|nr:ABC-type transport auxiliary lipoprotein family protein [Marinibacterium sp.]